MRVWIVVYFFFFRGQKLFDGGQSNLIAFIKVENTVVNIFVRCCFLFLSLSPYLGILSIYHWKRSILLIATWATYSVWTLKLHQQRGFTIEHRIYICWTKMTHTHILITSWELIWLYIGKSSHFTMSVYGLCARLKPITAIRLRHSTSMLQPYTCYNVICLDNKLSCARDG